MIDDNVPPAWWVEAQRADWKIGDRVRIALTGEYPLILLSSGGRIRAHQPAEDGRVGTITAIAQDGTACLYNITFDQPFAPFPRSPEVAAMFPSISEITISEWFYTAAELESLDGLDYLREMADYSKPATLPTAAGADETEEREDEQ